MPELDPQAREVLDRLAALGEPPLEAQTPAEARRRMALRSIGARGPSLPRVEDLEVAAGPGARGPNRARLYVERDEPGCVPLVYFHGGGWVLGDVETHDALCRALAKSVGDRLRARGVAAGVKVLSVDYRLAPEHRFPAAAYDALAAARWVAENAASIGVDADRLVLAGDSAGGNLAAVASLLSRDEGGPPIDAQVLIYPITDCDLDTSSYRSAGDGFGLTRSGMRWFWEHYVPDERERVDPRVSPLRAASLAGLPRALVQTATHDPLHDEGLAYATRLSAEGVPTQHSTYEGQVHGFVRMAAQIDRASDAIEEIAEFIATPTPSVSGQGPGPA